MKQIEDITDFTKTVVYRINKYQKVIALFPLVPSGTVSGECYAFFAPDPVNALQSFLNDNKVYNVEYWKSVQYNAIVEDSEPCTKEEYNDLHKLISALGHQLRVVTHEELSLSQ